MDKRIPLNDMDLNQVAGGETLLRKMIRFFDDMQDRYFTLDNKPGIRPGDPLYPDWVTHLKKNK